MQRAELSTLVTPCGPTPPHALLRLRGVRSVTVDRHRARLSVRFDPRLVDAPALHAALRPLPAEPASALLGYAGGLATVIRFVRARAAR